MDKKMMKILGIIAGVFLVLIILLFIISSCSKKKFDFYKFQDEMVAAAKSYYKNKSDELPVDDADTRTVTLKKLISEGYMQEPAKKYKNNSLSCDGSVTVQNNNGFYLYIPSATCGKDQRTQLFYDKVLDDSLVEEGVGLYQVGEQYIYRGEVTNNFVQIVGSEKVFRIIRINEDGSFRLIETGGIDTEVWDDRFNPSKYTNTGVNDYVANGLSSRIKDKVSEYYNDTTQWNDTIKSYILTQELCMGKRSINDTTKDGSTECSVKLDNQQLGLINVYEYLQASLDANCNSTDAFSCQNYNWLANTKKRLWTINGDADNNSKVWYKGEYISESNANSYHTISAVFNISGKVSYVKGNGTEESPYIIR